MGSVWDKVLDRQKYNPPGDYRPPYKDKHPWTHWPNPFPYVEDVQTVACSPNQLIKVKMIGNMVGRWAFDAFVPSPIEIARKTATGSYKCGFYLPGFQVGSPLDIIWEDGKASEALLGMTSPITTALFVIWATSTVIDFLDMAHTIALNMQRCEGDENETVLGDGSANFPSDNMTGGTPLYTKLWDPGGWADEVPGDIRYPTGGFSCEAFGTVSNINSTITKLEARLSIGGVTKATQDLGALGKGETVSYHLAGGGTFADAGAAQVLIHIEQHGQGPFDVTATTHRFISHHYPLPPQYQNYPNNIPDPCRAPWTKLQAAMLPVLGSP